MDEKTKPSEGVEQFTEQLSQKSSELGLTLDKIAEKFASLSLPGIILVITAYSSTGSTPIIAALLTLGGPLGILGGLGVLGLMTVVGDAVSSYSIEAVLSAIYTERGKKESLPTLLKEIEDLPITDTLKTNLMNTVKKSEADSSPKVIEIVES